MTSTALARSSLPYRSTRAELLPFVPTASLRILEIGCGRGYFGAFLREQNPARECWGLELDSEAAHEASAHFHRVLQGDAAALLDSDAIPREYFDLVVCNDVLEHFAEPEAVLAKIKSCLAPGGAVLASIPNLRHFRVLKELLLGKDFRYVEQGVLDRTHLRFFTSKSMRRLFEEAGFHIEIHRGINASRSLRPWFWTLLSLGHLHDTRFLQFATLARKK